MIKPTPDHIRELMTWFSNAQELGVWAGPDFEYPFTFESFTRDAKLDVLASWSLLDDASTLQAFGQYYLRLGRCHVGRLVVAPAMRGQGVAGTLIRMLAEVGQQELGVTSVSLFVLERNVTAIRAYEKLGFTCTAYPDEPPLANCLYMIRT